MHGCTWQAVKGIRNFDATEHAICAQLYVQHTYAKQENTKNRCASEHIPQHATLAQCDTKIINKKHKNTNCHNQVSRSSAAWAIETLSCHLGQGAPGLMRVHVPTAKRCRRDASHSLPRHSSNLAAQLCSFRGLFKCFSHSTTRLAQRCAHRPSARHMCPTWRWRRRKYSSSSSPGTRGTLQSMAVIFRCTLFTSSARVSWYGHLVQRNSHTGSTHLFSVRIFILIGRRVHVWLPHVL